MNKPLANESARLQVLAEYQILDTAAEQIYDDITNIAAFVANTPIALISLVDDHRQWFKSQVGLTVNQTPRAHAFCAHAIAEPERPMLITDATTDPRFADNPLVTSDPHIRFYYGVPLCTPEHLGLGTLCVIDRVARTLNDKQMSALQALARVAMTQIEARRHAALLNEAALSLHETTRQQQEYMERLTAIHSQLEQTNALIKADAVLNA